MKLSLVLFLAVAIFASVTYAYPEPQPDPLAEALAEALAEPGVMFKNIQNFIGRVYDYACKDHKGHNKCKAWAKVNITDGNFKKFLAQFEEDIKGFCGTTTNLIVKGLCKFHKNYMALEAMS